MTIEKLIKVTNQLLDGAGHQYSDLEIHFDMAIDAINEKLFGDMVTISEHYETEYPTDPEDANFDESKVTDNGDGTYSKKDPAEIFGETKEYPYLANRLMRNYVAHSCAAAKLTEEEETEEVTRRYAQIAAEWFGRIISNAEAVDFENAGVILVNSDVEDSESIFKEGMGNGNPLYDWEV